ncbi:hypothetical protein Tco_1186278 [Tanacetum coccineum]
MVLSDLWEYTLYLQSHNPGSKEHLLKWSIHMRKALLPEKEVPKPEDVEPEFQVDEEEDIDDRLKEILEDLKNPMKRKRKQAQNEIAKRKERERKRNAVGMKSDVKKDGYTDRDLFTKMDVRFISFHNFLCRSTIFLDSEDESLTDIDSDEERRRWMEEYMEEAYEQYLTKQEGSAKQRKRMKKMYSKPEDIELFEARQGDDEDVDAIYPDEDSGNDQTDPESNPLMVSLDDNEPTEEEISVKWFSQDAFDDDNEQKHIKMDLSEDKEDEEEDEMHMDKKPDNQIMSHINQHRKLNKSKLSPFKLLLLLLKIWRLSLL